MRYCIRRRSLVSWLVSPKWVVWHMVSGGDYELNSEGILWTPTSMVSWHVCVNLFLTRLWDLLFHFFFLLITYNKTTIQVCIARAKLKHVKWRRRRPIILTLKKHWNIRWYPPRPYARLKYLMVEVELAPLFKDTELNISCFMGVAYLMLEVVIHGRQGCGYAPMQPLSSLKSSEVSLAVLTQRSRIQALSMCLRHNSGRLPW